MLLQLVFCPENDEDILPVKTELSLGKKLQKKINVFHATPHYF